MVEEYGYVAILGGLRIEIRGRNVGGIWGVKGGNNSLKLTCSLRLSHIFVPATVGVIVSL